MVRTRSSNPDSTPKSPHQEMSETKEKDDGGGGGEMVVDASGSVRRADDAKQEGSFRSVENGNVGEDTVNGEALPRKTDVEIVAAGEDNVVVSGEVKDGGTLPEKMDIEMVVGDEGNVEPQSTGDQCGQEEPRPSVAENGDDGELVKQGGEGQKLDKPGEESPTDVKSESVKLAQSSDHGCEENAEPSSGGAGDTVTVKNDEPVTLHAGFSDVKGEGKKGKELDNKANGKEVTTPMNDGKSNSKYMFLSGDRHAYEGNDSGTEEEQLDFVKEIENFFKERSLEFKPPKFYGDTVNCLKLYRIVTRMGGYDKVTSSKLWKDVGAFFKPPRTCTSLSYSFRSIYEKALLDYEKHEAHGGELSIPIPSQTKPMNVDTKATPMTVDTKAKPKNVDTKAKPKNVDIKAKPRNVDTKAKPVNVDTKAMNVDNQAPGTGRRRRDAAARAMQGWHSQRLLANGEVSEPIIKDKTAPALQKQEKQHKTSGSQKRKKPPSVDPVTKAARNKPTNLQLDVDVSDLGPPADWVKVNVQKTKDCFEVYALVPGLLREEVRVQTGSAGRLVISGEPENPDNPWGVTSFKKAVTLPSRIDPHHTSAVVTQHGQLFVRVPFERSEQ